MEDSVYSKEYDALLLRAFQAEKDMQALESKMWARYQNGRDKPSEEDVEGPATVVQGEYDPTGWWRYS